MNLSNAGFDLFALLFVQRVPVEPVVPNILKFDILLTGTVLPKSVHVFFYILDVLQYRESRMKSCFDSVHGTLSLNLS